MSITLLLDADIVAFQLAATHQRTYRFPGMEAPCVAADDFETLPLRIDAEVSKLTQAVKADHVIVCLSCPTEENWRLKVLPSYKGHRDYSQRPVHLKAVKDYLEANYPSYRRDTLEADDIMGILSTMKGLPKNFLAEHPQIPATSQKVIVSEDKDMKTIPGWLWNPKKDKAPWLVCEDQANYWHFYQTLVGDTTDGYKGLPGCGEARAVKVLDYPSWDSVDERWRRVVVAFEAKGHTEEDALVQARVARICRASDYDFKKKEVILWKS
ncbi:hypothetical protein [Rhizobacter sp. Root1221]|uniref:hypothetical protein n=1 Tax=Rhizobacter sp. Root1221 TaxID=1736433 RepID=UPI0006FC2361|nr:hypothetical protein [Rhizobacter sp. Root1221]KQW02223.1 hypothetical protein ASC87_13410 [Rhizobacter sp. Root1221]